MRANLIASAVALLIFGAAAVAAGDAPRRPRPPILDTAPRRDWYRRLVATASGRG